MKLFIAVIALLGLAAGLGIYLMQPVEKTAWVDGPFKSYRYAKSRLNFKAMAIDQKRKKHASAISFTGPEAAIEQALFNCRKIAPNCEIYALGDDIVMGQDAPNNINLIEAYWSKHAGRIFSSPWKGRRLNGEEIVSTLTNMTAYGVTRNRLRIRLTWKSEGRLIGEVLNNTANPPRRDIARWWLEGDNLCRQYNNWYRGQKLCGALRIDGPQYLIYGETGDLQEIFRPVGD